MIINSNKVVRVIDMWIGIMFYIENEYNDTEDIDYEEVECTGDVRISN